MAWCRHSYVVMGAHERLPSCSLFLLMNKGVKCILTFKPFGRFPIAAKSQDTKNKSAAESMQGSLYFQTDVRQSLPRSTTREGSRHCVCAGFSAST